MEEEKKKLYPLGEFDINAFPSPNDSLYMATEEELIKLRKHELKWSSEDYEAEEDVFEESEVDGEIVKTKIGTKTITKTRPILIPNDPSEENAIRDAQEEIAALKAELAKTDYEAIKFAEGEMSDIAYETFRVKRKQARARINELQKTYNLE